MKTIESEDPSDKVAVDKIKDIFAFQVFSGSHL